MLTNNRANTLEPEDITRILRECYKFNAHKFKNFEEMDNYLKIKIYQKFKQELIPILSKPFKNTGEEGTLPYLFYEASITMVTKARQRYYKKTIDNSSYEH